MSALPNNIRALREAAGLSIEALAQASGLEPTQLQRLEEAVTRPNTRLRHKIATALSCPPEALLLGNARDDQPNNIRALREQAGYSIAELAEKSGVNITQVIDLERNNPRPPRAKLEKFSIALSCTTDDLLHEPHRWASRLKDIRADNQMLAQEDAGKRRFQNKLRAIRLAAEITVKEMAESTGEPSGRLQRMERGEARIPPAVADSLAKLLNCEPGDFYYQQR